MPMKFFKRLNALVLLSGLLLAAFLVPPSLSFGETDFIREEARFRNFVTCELTRNGALSYFDEQPFTITMVDLFAVARELDLTVLTGAAQCSVNGVDKTLYLAVGVRQVEDSNQVQYFVVRHRDFRILGTELMRYPYKQKCGWQQYWVDTDS